jgi:hypothetical protein
MSKPETSGNMRIPKGLRLLNSNELVSSGDFVEDELRGFTPWEGPNGFRADSFVRLIYRQNGSHAKKEK